MDNFLFAIFIIVVFGIGSLWVSWATKLPAILFWLVSGFLAGPVFHWIPRDFLASHFLYAIVSVGVALILFEGSLQLKVKDLEASGRDIGNLVLKGAVVSWAAIGLLAHYLLGLSWALSCFLGAVLIVTGPTVILPILRQVRPQGKVASILKWEGIVIDPVGALCAVVAYEVIISGRFSAAVGVAGWVVLKTVVVGILGGVVAGVGLMFCLRKYWVPDNLHNPFVLMVVVALFWLCSALSNEPSGFLAVTVMGIFLANQKIYPVRNIVQFKEDMRSLILPSLFIVLAAGVPLRDLYFIDARMWLFVFVLIFVVRPLAVFLATMGSDMNAREKIFLSFMAPRGVVAAAVVSIFALRLAAHGYPDAHKLISAAFFVITVTVLGYGLLALPLARRLGIASKDPGGILFLGGGAWVREAARLLRQEKVRTVIVDSNAGHVALARDVGADAYQADFLDEDLFDKIDMSDIANVAAVTPNSDANTLAILYFREVFDRRHLFQIQGAGRNEQHRLNQNFAGRALFSPEVTAESIDRMLREGAVFEIVESGTPRGGRDSVPLFAINRNDRKAFPVTEGLAEVKPELALLVLKKSSLTTA